MSQKCHKLQEFPKFHNDALLVRLPLGDEFLRKSLFIVVLQFSINVKRFNSQIHM
jgi:hypothetical protein